MAPFGEHAAWFAFTSDRFDHSSDLPLEANAGNRFYGRDVASFVTEGLAKRGLDASFFDEDWGWQAHAKRLDGSILEISIYHNPDEDPATEDAWALMLRSLHKERKLGIARLRETEIDADVVSTLEDVFRQAGIALRRTSPH
jgi:hypothetical protein